MFRHVEAQSLLRVHLPTMAVISKTTIPRTRLVFPFVSVTLPPELTSNVTWWQSAPFSGIGGAAHNLSQPTAMLDLHSATANSMYENNPYFGSFEADFAFNDFLTTSPPEGAIQTRQSGALNPSSSLLPGQDQTDATPRSELLATGDSELLKIIRLVQGQY